MRKMARRRPAAPNGIAKSRRLTRTSTHPALSSKQLEQSYEKTIKHDTCQTQRLQPLSPESSYKEVNVVGCTVQPRNTVTTFQQPSRPKRKPVSEDQIPQQPPAKKSRRRGTVDEPPDITSPPAKTSRDAIAYWTEYRVWPSNFAEMASGNKSGDPKKRRRSSYSKEARDGNVPSAYSPEYEYAMQQHGMYMDNPQNEVTINNDSELLCQQLFTGTYDHSNEWFYSADLFAELLRNARLRNEARVVRDITPSLVPSAEVLKIRFKLDELNKSGTHNSLDNHNKLGLEQIAEAVGEDWTNCDQIFGPKPRSDYTVGLAPSAFTAPQKNLLDKHHSKECPTHVISGIYFPFLICEVKCQKQGLEEAERQAMHSSSVAVKAMVELFRRVSRAEDLNQTILAFSICHDHRTLRVHGHYAQTTGSITKYYRHRIRTINFDNPDGENRWTAYNFTRKVYDDFVPIHLERICDALSDLQGKPIPPSSTSEMSFNNDTSQSDAQEGPATAPSSEGGSQYPIPFEPASRSSHRENRKLREQLSRQEQKMEQQMEQLRKDSKEREDRMEQQRKEREDRMEQQRKESEERLTRQIDGLLQHIAK